MAQLIGRAPLLLSFAKTPSGGQVIDLSALIQRQPQPDDHHPAPVPTASKYLLRDRDTIYGEAFQRRLAHMGIRQVLIAPHVPWQNPFAERVIGSIRRECLDHFIVFNERHLRHLLRAYLAYYNTARTHQALRNNSPQPREVQPPARGHVVATPQVGDLHHRYERAA